MNYLEINKVLSNQARVNILQWLKAPDENFPPHVDLGHFKDGVCAQYIQVKLKLSQSTVSHYLSMMEKVGLLIPTRHGKWTYYRRNEKTIKAYIHFLRMNL